jgi:1-acyl-sn-glycerol-3-phosphate acyltransferase
MSPSPRPSLPPPPPDGGPARLGFVATRRFAPYTLVQFLGAVVDHLALAALVAAITGALGARAAAAGVELLLPGLALLLPFLVLSGVGGQLADRLDKAAWIRRLKAVEVAIAALAILAMQAGSIVALSAALLAFGVRAALFGPVKLAILPRHLHRDDLLDGTALAVAATVLAILVGAGIGTALAPSPSALGALIGAAAIVGWLASLSIPPAPGIDEGPASGHRAAFGGLFDAVGWAEVWRPLAVRNSVLGISWFWALGAVLVALAPEALAGRIAPSIALALGAVGVVVGALLAIAASRRQVEIGLVPIGALGISLAGLAGWFALGPLPSTPSTVGAMTALAGIGVAAGLYVVPLYGLLLTRVPRSRLGRAVAANNIANAVLMLAAGGIASALLAAGVGPGAILLGAVVANVLVAAWIFVLVPEFLLRLLAWLLANVLYRLEVHGRDRIPADGPVLIVCNHVSFMDAIILLGAIRRPTRFVMYWKIFDQPLMKWVFRAARAIPIAGRNENAELMEAAFATVRGELDSGEVVGIFPEGGLTRDGAIAPFRPGVERILAANPVPVVPMALRGLWGSLFSRKHRFPIPRRFRARIALVIGEPIAPEEASAAALEARVRELRGDWA